MANEGSGLEVNLVVLFVLGEDKAGRYRRLRQIERNGTLKVLVEKFDNTTARIRYGLGDLDDGDTEEGDDSSSILELVISDASFYELIANTIVVND